MYIRSRILELLTAARMVAVFISLISSSWVFAQSEFSPDTLYQFNYQVANTSSLNSPVDARLRVRIYAYDHRLADVSAVVLKDAYVNRLQSDTEYHVAFTGEDLEQALQQYHGSDRILSDHDAGVYLIWTVDINGDGQICEGDLQLDYNKMPDLFYGIRPRSAGLDEKVTVYLAPVQGGACQSLE
ncbi:hypothetical protein IOQ59_16155 [Pontibacterium sp. N1Y112]|uniref:Uncharacterized protein n=1 Tax=Pontibacterium sinense TaxID=2781979 RepID=A0A8J7FFV9_9GAMM|nr:hypothetical protein [Pontibacterium sinense]MBE9398794.1 hypothetical protein [Pontibacterium sinense]